MDLTVTASTPEHLQDSPDNERAFRASLLAELDQYYAECKDYKDQEPDQVLIHISGVLARLTEVRAGLMRRNKGWAEQLRLKEVDPLLDSVDKQFRIHSRLQAIRQMDFDITRGAPS